MTTSWIDPKAIKAAKLAMAEAIIEGGQSDRLLDLVGHTATHPGDPGTHATPVHGEHPRVVTPRSGVKGQQSWMEQPHLDARGQGREDPDQEGVHYHAPDIICPLRSCTIHSI